MAMRRTRRTTRRMSVPRRTMTRRVARPWCREEMAFMRKYYRNYETAWIARQLGRTVYAIRYKAVDLSIKKASPSVWRGNRGSNSAFRKPTTRTTRKPAMRKSAMRRTTRSSTWRATSKRPMARKPMQRRTRRMR
ncbi:MAG: hypothetical protein KAU35_11070 [candidate division Zixibacteria bacterium]|nr:hypothetical protein [candidate division Zixibacteria bacterium]